MALSLIGGGTKRKLAAADKPTTDNRRGPVSRHIAAVLIGRSIANRYECYL
jgi:nitric oxide reductase activation protein